MAEMKSLLEGGPRGALSEGAARFDDLARNVKSQQVSQAQGTAPRKVNLMHVASPDEEWSKRFMSRGIGPVPELSRVAGWMPQPPMPKVTLDIVPSREPVVEKSVSESFAPGAPMGRSIGKPEAPRRSWLGRLFRGD
jgi:hypothetical protein